MLTNFLREKDATSLLKWSLMIQLIKKPSLWTRVESLQPVGTGANQAEPPRRGPSTPSGDSNHMAHTHKLPAKETCVI